MVKRITLIALLVLCVFLNACSKDYKGEYIEWSTQSDNTSLMERLEDNGIPFKVEGDTLFIPEDAINDAVNCCS